MRVEGAERTRADERAGQGGPPIDLSLADVDEDRSRASLITDLMHRTALLEFVPRGEVIAAGTKRAEGAEGLLTLCHDAVRDPWSLEGWFRHLAAREPAP